MKAKQKTLLILLALTAVLGAGLLALTRANERAEQAASDAQEGTIPLSSFAVDSLTRIAYTYGGETVTLDYSGGVWTLASDPSYHISQSLCDTMASALCALNAKRCLEPGEGEDYGIDVPLVTVEVTAEEQTHTFRFGDTNGITGDIYLQKDGGADVYTVASSKAACFEYSKEELFEPFNPAGLTSSALEEIEYEVSGTGEAFTVHLKAVSEAVTAEDRQGDAASAPGAQNTETEAEAGTAEYQTVWRLASDPEAELDSAALDALLSALSGYVSGQITTPARLADYGLDAPLVTVRAVTGDGEKRLCYSIGTDGYYMQTEGDPAVYCVDGSVVEAFCRTEAEWIVSGQDKADPALQQKNEAAE